MRLQFSIQFRVVALLLVACGRSAPAQDRELAQSKPPAGAAKAKLPVRGPPDYTKLTGALDDVALPLEKPVVLWRVVVEPDAARAARGRGISLTDVVIADGVAYFGNDLGHVYAISTKDGAQLWTHEHGARVAGVPSVDRDHVYFTSHDKGLAALQRSDGTLVWSHAIPHGTDITPIPVGNRLFVSGYDGKAYAFDRTSGEVLWEHDFGADAPPNPKGFKGAQARFQDIVARPGGAACDGKTFVQCVFDQSRVIALDCATGKRLWTFQAAGWMSSTPTIVSDRVYVASQDDFLYCLDLGTGAVVWKFKTPGWVSTGLAVHEGIVYLPHHRGRLFRINANTGEMLRSFQSPEPADEKSLHGGDPLIANDTVYFTTNSGTLLAVDLATNKLRWLLRPSEGSRLPSSLATDGRRIFLRSSQDNDQAGESAILVIGRDP
jgi:outer membrane protein assembly factor BamB